MRVIQDKIHLNPSKDSLKKFNSPVTEKPSAVENSRLPLNEFPFTVQGSGDFQSFSAGCPAPIFKHHGTPAEKREREKGISARRNAGVLPWGIAVMKLCG